MPPWFFGVLVNGAIPFLGGAYATVLAFRLVGPRPGVNQKQDEWHLRWGGFMRVGGPMLILFGIFLWVSGGIQHSTSNPRAQVVWVRHKTSDGVVSAEFPAPPTAVSKESQGVVMHNVTLSQNEKDRHFFLSWSVVAPIDGVSDEQVLDRLRESILEVATQLGKPLTFVSEEAYGEGGFAGRVFTFDAKGKYTQRMKCLIVNERCYRVCATTPRTPQDEADAVRFISSFRLEKGNK